MGTMLTCRVQRCAGLCCYLCVLMCLWSAASSCSLAVSHAIAHENLLCRGWVCLAVAASCKPIPTGCWPSCKEATAAESAPLPSQRNIMLIRAPHLAVIRDLGQHFTRCQKVWTRASLSQAGMPGSSSCQCKMLFRRNENTITADECTGGGFHLVSCPHYLGEILIYAGLLLVSSTYSRLPYLVFVWVVCLLLTSKLHLPALKMHHRKECIC